MKMFNLVHPSNEKVTKLVLIEIFLNRTILASSGIFNFNFQNKLLWTEERCLVAAQQTKI